MDVWWRVVAVICLAAVPTVMLCPQDGLEFVSIHVPKVVLKTFFLCNFVAIFYKFFIAVPERKPDFIYFSTKETMRAQAARNYGAPLQLVSDHPRPKVVHPDDVLVRVHAASINPIDVQMLRGHGRGIFNRFRKDKQLPFGGAELPLVLGRDCSGVVEAVGSRVTKFLPGDEVYLSVCVEDIPGTFAELVLAKEFMVARKPRTLDHTQAASIPYICTTTWKALVTQCGLGPNTTAGKRVLILAGTGGVGSFAIQLVKAWGGHVTTTCRTDGVALVESLGADDVIDYTQLDLTEALAQREKFDVAFVTLGQSTFEPCLRNLNKGGRASTIVVPFVVNLSKYGFFLGTLMNLPTIIKWKIQDLIHNRKFMFTFNRPDGTALAQTARLIDEGKIRPVIQQTFGFEEANEAVEFLKKGHARGKTVVVMPTFKREE